MKFFGKSYDSHAVACVLMSIVGISVLFSPPVMNLAALLLLAVILSSAELRQSLWDTWRLPMVKFVLLFYAVMIVGTTYSIAPKDVAVRMAIGWSKLLLVPIALSLFADTRWKLRFLKAFVGVVAVCSVISFGLWIFEIDLPVASKERGIFLRNHATQGMAFAVGAFGALLLALESGAGRLRYLYALSGLLLLGNIALVTIGRSGYLVAIVCAIGAVSGYVFFGQRRLGVRKALEQQRNAAVVKQPEGVGDVRPHAAQASRQFGRHLGSLRRALPETLHRHILAAGQCHAQQVPHDQAENALRAE